MLRLNLFLMLIWVMLSGGYTPANLLLGFTLGNAVLWMVYRRTPNRRYFARLAGVVTLVGYFIWEIIRSSIRVAYEIVTPTHYMRPAIVAVPLDVQTDFEIFLLSSLITLTPGSLAIDVSEDRSVMFVHLMYFESVEQTIGEIKQGFERRVREVTEQ